MSTDSAARILDAVLPSRHGIGGVSMRSAARKAGVALGLVHYHFDDKTSLICAALRRIEDQDVTLVEPDPSLPPEERLRVAAPEFLTTEYLSLRLQLWSLAQAGEEFERINTAAQSRYRAMDPSRTAGTFPARVRETGRGRRRHPERHVAHRPARSRPGVAAPGRLPVRGHRTLLNDRSVRSTTSVEPRSTNAPCGDHGPTTCLLRYPGPCQLHAAADPPGRPGTHVRDVGLLLRDHLTD